MSISADVSLADRNCRGEISYSVGGRNVHEHSNLDDNKDSYHAVNCIASSDTEEILIYF